MLIYRNFNQFQSNTNLYTAAATYLEQGFSVIPTHANKVAATDWKDYQTKTAALSDFQQWFVTENRQALGIICGKLSRLIALDFDTEAQFTRFQSEHPELTTTLTTNTRRGNHLWYSIPENTHVASRHADGIDLLAEGCYVIAPPSTINGYTYTFANELPIMELTPKDIQRIETFVGGNILESQTGQGEPAPPISTVELVKRYRKHAQVGNRNIALFYAALAARDAGWSVMTVIELLANEYVASGTGRENPDKRYRQAVRTIESAFSRPARSVEASDTFTLPNTIKEALFQQKLTCAVRLFEALWLLGYRPNSIIHPRTLRGELKGVIGWYSIHKALKAHIGADIPLFEPVFGYEMVSPRTPSNEASAIPPSPDGDKMLLSGRKNHKKPSQGGRPMLHYRIRDFHELFQTLAIESSRISDVLPVEAIGSAKKTRKAMEEALIRRSPGNYGRKMIADKLGVSIRTVDTYHKEFLTTYGNFHKVHRFIEKPIYWSNLKQFPDESTLHNGYFLMDETGKRYPAKKSVAIMLLKRKHKVTLMRQTWNAYWFGLSFCPPTCVQHSQGQTVEATDQPEYWREKADAYWSGLHDAPATPNRPNLPQNGVFTESTTQHKQEGKKALKKPLRAKKDKKPHNPKRPFPDTEDEAVVEALQERINALCKQPGQGISKRNVRWLIVTYGKAAVKAAIQVVRERQNIENPVGFIAVKLRSDTRTAELRQRTIDLMRQTDEENRPQPEPSENKDATNLSLSETSDSPVENVEQTPQDLSVCHEDTPEQPDAPETEVAPDTDLWQGTCWKDWFYLIPQVQQQQTFLLDIKEGLLDRNDFEAVRKAVQKYTTAVPKGFE